MYKKIAIFAVLSGILLTGCGSMTEEISDNSIPVGAAIETETEAEPAMPETTEAETTEETEEAAAEIITDAPTERSSEPEAETLENIPETELEHTQQSGLMPGIHLGMTLEEVLSFAGEKYGEPIQVELFDTQGGSGYYYRMDAEVAGMTVPGYAFFEFDAEKELLDCYGFDLGQTGDFDSPEYPLSEEKLAAIHDAYLSDMISWYGEPDEPEYQTEDDGLRSESAWYNEDGKFWLIYGVNLWAWEEPKQYEKGINEVLVSCSAR